MRQGVSVDKGHIVRSSDCSRLAPQMSLPSWRAEPRGGHPSHVRSIKPLQGSEREACPTGCRVARCSNALVSHPPNAGFEGSGHFFPGVVLVHVRAGVSMASQTNAAGAPVRRETQRLRVRHQPATAQTVVRHHHGAHLIEQQCGGTPPKLAKALSTPPTSTAMGWRG